MFTECSLFVKLSKSEHFLLPLYIQLEDNIFWFSFAPLYAIWKRQYLLWNTNYIQIFNFHFVKSHIGPALVLQIILTSYWGFWWSLWLCKTRDLSKTSRRRPLRTLTWILDLPNQPIIVFEKNISGNNLTLCDSFQWQIR